MSPFPKTLRRGAGDQGFTLLEVVVAMGLFALVSAATLPMVLTATKAGLVTKLDTGAKALAQERFEYLRSLPYHLDNSASTGLDLLDQYYPAQATRPAAQIAANGFTSAGSGWVAESQTSVASKTAPGFRLPSEPSSGAFYRSRYVPTGTDGNYVLFTTVQFLDAQRVPVAQSRFTSYRSVDAAGTPVVDGTDTPPSALVGVTVTAYWSAGQLRKAYDAFTEIAEGAASVALINAQARATAVEIEGTLDSARTMHVRAGSVNLDAAQSTNASATAAATGASIVVTPDTTGTGAKLGSSGTNSGPPDVSLNVPGADPDELVDSGRTVASFGPTAVDNLSVVSTGPPSVAAACTSSGNDCVAARVRANTSEFPLYVSNHPDVLSGAVVWAKQTTGGAEVAAGRGWITSTPDGTTHSVTAGVRTSLTTSGGQTLRIWPTAAVPDGLVQVDLGSASLTCAATGASSTAPLPSYTATLRYYRYNTAAPASSGYQSVSLSLATSDPLASLNLATIPVGVEGTVVRYLGDYIDSWGSLTSAVAAASGRVSTTGNSVSNNIEAVVTVRTKPTRAADVASGVSVRLGVMSCLAEDNR